MNILESEVAVPDAEIPEFWDSDLNHEFLCFGIEPVTLEGTDGLYINIESPRADINFNQRISCEADSAERAAEYCIEYMEQINSEYKSRGGTESLEGIVYNAHPEITPAHGFPDGFSLSGHSKNYEARLNCHSCGMPLEYFRGDRSWDQLKTHFKCEEQTGKSLNHSAAENQLAILQHVRDDPEIEDAGLGFLQEYHRLMHLNYWGAPEVELGIMDK